MSEQKIERYKSRESNKNLHFHQNSSKLTAKSNYLLKELDDVEIYEWGHLKLLKVNRFLKKKKYEEVIEFLSEIMTGIESKTWDSNDKMKTRILEEIKLPAMKKLRSIYLNNKNFQDALEICEKILEIDNNEENISIYGSLKRALENKNLHENSRFLQDNRVVIEVNSMSKLTKSEEENELNEKSTFHASEEERVLRYNDDFEDMKYMGALRYIFYPLKQGVKKISSLMFCCKKKKTPSLNEINQK